MNKEEIIAAIKECAEKLGHVPSFPELLENVRMTKRAIRSVFGTYSDALKACGLERRGSGYEVAQRALFEDWARLVRSLRKIPTIMEWEMHGQYSVTPMLRLYGGWRTLPEGMLEYAKREGLDVEWEDVLKIIAEHLGPEQEDKRRSSPPVGTTLMPRVRDGEPIYGTPLLHEVMSYAPTNEMGVLGLFVAEAKRLGFKILRLQAGYPDCEAMREVAPGRWQRVRIEFEFESRNFLAHGHRVGDCELIVCWENNWQNCPVEVIELKALVENQNR
ncbi:MAG TPA: hypothetical protein VFR84_17375 [Candidatus Angelobacter sp.]|nr:hypothetical protein [Candidatus Angelobacter sp.]